MKRAGILLAKCVVAAEALLFPLLAVAFIFLILLTPSSSEKGIDFSHLSLLSVVKPQYSFLEMHGLITMRTAEALRIYSAFIVVSIIIGILRVLSGPILFYLFDVKLMLNRARLSLPRFIIGWLFFSLSFIPCTLNISISAKVSVIRTIIEHATTLYVLLQTLVFVFGIVVFVEGLLGCANLALANAKCNYGKR